MQSGNVFLNQVDELLATNHLSWLLGAGTCVDANIPLMIPLTSRIFAICESQRRKDRGRAARILQAIQDELGEKAHIEHILNQMGDYIAMAERRKDNRVKIGRLRSQVTPAELKLLHTTVQRWIADTIRWGYVPPSQDRDEQIGEKGSSIVDKSIHEEFVKALFDRGQAGIENRRVPVQFFTTNYDTLLEDSLALCRLSYWDGFSGGAVAFHCHQYGSDPPPGVRAHVVKLHGSIDWHLGPDNRVYRMRDGDKCTETGGKVLIYPQATKYLATQRDPFAAQFDVFRRKLNLQAENVLAICGYSFGDEHINSEIELALEHEDNKTTLLVFAEKPNNILESWMVRRKWGHRLYIMTAQGLYVGNQGLVYKPPTDKTLEWWTFSGVTRLLKSGTEIALREWIE